MTENKKEFVEKYLQPMIKQADCRIESVTYRKTEYDELVDIEYIGGFSFCVCVTADSNEEIVKDVLRRIW